jgi:tetratricopeptide (TPR) repeat protein
MLGAIASSFAPDAAGRTLSEVFMRRAAFLFAILLLVAGPVSAQIGKYAVIGAGSPEDRTLKAINDAASPAEKLALLDKFVVDYGKTDAVLAAYELYISVYGAQKNYDKAFEYGDKMFAADPDSIATSFTLFQLAREKNDPEKMFAYGEKMEDIIARYKASPAPAGYDARDWPRKQAESLGEVKENVTYVQTALFQVVSQLAAPAQKAALLERYATGFPDSPYAASAQSMVATAYQQAKDFAKMQQFAERILARDPGNISMLLLLADDGGERRVNLDKAEEYAHHAIDLLGKAAKPEDLSDEQWTQQKSLQQGLAWSSLGQIQLQRNQNTQAVESFKTAAPLLQSDNFSYARNQYRLGFAYVNLKRNAEARAAFAEAASVDSPYKGPAEEKVASFSATAPAKKRP